MADLGSSRVFGKLTVMHDLEVKGGTTVDGQPVVVGNDARLTDARPPTTHNHAWEEVTGKPSTFTPATHNHPTSEVDGLDTALAGKVDKVTGKGLSTEDYTTTEKNKLDGIQAGAQVNPTSTEILAAIKAVDGHGSGLDADTLDGKQLATLQSEYQSYANQAVADLIDSSPDALNTLNELAAALGDDPNFAATMTTELGKKVDKVTGKGLSTNDYTTTEKNKLAGIQVGAQVNVGTNLGLTGTGNSRQITSSTGNNVTIPVATTANAGLMSTGDKSKLDGVEAGATKDQTAAEIKAALLTVDGAGSGVDADTVDGLHAAHFIKRYSSNGGLGPDFNLMYGNNPGLPNENAPEGGGGLIPGNGDGASATEANVKIGSWYGIGFCPTVSRQSVPKGENALWMDVRVGDFTARRHISAKKVFSNGWEAWTSGNDGAGSGLDADTVDGIQGSSLLQNNIVNHLGSAGGITFHGKAFTDYKHPTDGNASVALAVEDDYLRYRFGGSALFKGIRLDHYDVPAIELNRLGKSIFHEGLILKGSNQLVVSVAGNYAKVIHRNDGSNYYFLLTDPTSNDNANWNNLRPFAINLTTGEVVVGNGFKTVGNNHFTGPVRASDDVRLDNNKKLVIGDGRASLIGESASTTLSGVGNILILADSDKVSSGEYLSLGAGHNLLTIQGGAKTNTGIKFNNHNVWHAGNDGSGSGLDADTIDGKHASDLVNPTAYKSVGSYVMASHDYVDDAPYLAPGTTVAGSMLYPASARQAIPTGTTYRLPGTWRLMGGCVPGDGANSSGRISLWLRIT